MTNHKKTLAPTDIKLNFQDFLSAGKGYTDKTAASLVEYSANVLSQSTNSLVQRIESLKNFSRVPSVSAIQHENVPIDLKLFNASSSIKILTSNVAMHLEANFRESLFSQIDFLHDINGWDPDDRPIQTASFYTFLRTILLIKPRRFPSLGLSNNGNLLAGWIHDKDRLSIEFLPNDVVKYVISKSYDGEVDRSAGRTTLDRLPVHLQPYKPGDWFN